MKPINEILLFLLLWALNAQAEIDATKLIQAPREFSVGMTESMLSGQKDGLFPGPSIRIEGGNFFFKTFMEIDGMGSPGHRSFYYLFEDNELQGVIQTTNLIGLEKDEATRIAAFNYNGILRAVSGQSKTSEILRKDGESFSKVTLERWSINDGAISVFHVATNYESSVGVLSSHTHFPTDQLFVSAADQRFQGQIRDEATIVDIPREELRKTVELRPRERKREDSNLASSKLQEKANYHELDKGKSSTSSVQDPNEYAPPYFKWMLITCVFLSVIYVFWKIRKYREQKI